MMDIRKKINTVGNAFFVGVLYFMLFIVCWPYWLIAMPKNTSDEFYIATLPGALVWIVGLLIAIAYLV